MASLPPTAKYAAGVLIGDKYRLERKLGEGGMGSVWAAHHKHLDAAVAIKLIRSDSNRLELGPRLVQEARAAAKLGHPAIVRVFDVGQTTEGDPFIVMELLEGQSLSALLAREQRLSAPEAVRLLLPIVDALRAAHAKGIIHRDIKPDNVFLVSDDTGVQPKLVDFGIAKFGPREFDDFGGATFGPHEVASHLTQRGAIVGSPDYMAPEQARGEDIDPRADVWSFCVMLYECISGRSPFDGETYQALFRAILDWTPPSLASLLAADAELSQIVETGMSKDRARRFQSMQELGEALARWLLRHGIFEDASGGAIEAKWVLRRSDPGHRQSRPSLGSTPDSVATMPGLGSALHGPPQRIRVDAPTSVGPVVTGTRRRPPRRRLIVPLALGLVAFVALAARFLRPDSVTARASVPAPGAAAPRSLPTAVSPTAAALAAPTPSPAAQPTLANAPAASGASPASSSDRRRPRRPAKQSAAPAPAPKPGLDLIAPY